MANTLSREIPLKFTKSDFREMDTPNLLINVWTYNYYKPHCQNCNACKIYADWNVEILAERWKEEWGDMNNAVEKLKKNDKDFININNHSEYSRWGIINELVLKNK